MKRRDFLKLLGVAPLAPSVLATIPKEKSPIIGKAEEPDPQDYTTYTFGNNSSYTCSIYAINSEGKYVELDSWSKIE